MMSSIYTFFTEETILDFEQSGLESLIETFQQLVVDQLIEDKEDFLSNIFTELFFIFEEGRLTLDQLTEFLSRCIQDDLTAEIFCQVLDVFPISEPITVLIDEVYLERAIIKTSTLVQGTSPETLQKFPNIIGKNGSTLTRQLNLRKRDEFYTQKKFNLLHEVNEGYAKLIVEIYQIMRIKDDLSKYIDHGLKVVNQLIGHYNLDPNRVLDILIEIFGNQIVGNHEFAIGLLKKSQWWPLVNADCNSLGIEALSNGGSDTASKIFGLRYLKAAGSRDLPETFKILLAILVREGFISFGSIYRYIVDDITQLEKEFKKDLEDQVFRASASALALAAPLLDEEEDDSGNSNGSSIANGNGSKINSSASGSENSSAAMSKLDSLIAESLIYQYLRIFLANGLYYPSIYILSQHSFLSQVGEIPALMNRLTDYVVTQFWTLPFSSEDLKSFQTSKKIAFSRPNNTLAYEEFPSISLLTFKPLTASYSTKKFTYFYKEWLQGLPKVELMKDLVAFSKEFLRFFPINLAQDLQLYTKICEIVSREMKNNGDEIDWFSYFRNFLLPPIPIISENSFAIDKAYEILSKFPIEDRFNLYGEMYNVVAKNNPFFKIAYGKAEKSTKDVLKRLSKENVRPMMRRLAKISFTNPLPCFLTILQQIESYDNLNSLVVETARYFNNYGWDNLTLAILMRLTASGRSVIQNDGMNDRQWIQSLSSFIGKLCHRYPGSINIRMILTFLLKSFHNGETFGLIVLKEILIAMGGIQSINNLTLHQIDMINCGGSLSKVVYRTIDDTRYDRIRSGRALLKILKEIDGINELLVIFCQLENSMIYQQDTTNQHLKVLASRDDDLKNVLHLLTELVGFFATHSGQSGSQTMNSDTSLGLLPIKELCTEYQVEPEWAFEIWRSSSENSFALSNIEVDYNPCSNNSISNAFYDTFWKLSLFDINFTSELYSIEAAKLKSSISTLKDSIQFNSRNKDVSVAVVERLKKDLATNEQFILQIPHDEEIHKGNFELISEKLKTEKSQWFAAGVDYDAILQYCVLPRAIHSPFDAAFCAKFLILIHQNGAENYDLFDLLDTLFNKNILFGTLFTLTPTEAENLGLFFAGILKSLKDNDDTFTTAGAKQKVFNYHSNLLSDLEQSLTTKEYMSRRNAITFLKNLLGVYPTVEDHCEKVLKLITIITNNDERGDLRLSSSALIGHLKSKSKEWVHMWDFFEMDEASKAEQMNKREAIKKADAERLQKLREAQEIKKKKEEEEVRKRREAEEEKRKAAEVAAASAKALSYDDASSSTSANSKSRNAVSSRNEQSSKSRYDYYSKFSEDKKASSTSPAVSGTTTPSQAPRVANIPSRPSSTLSKQESSAPESTGSDLKSRLKEAKLAYKSKAIVASEETALSKKRESTTRKQENTAAPPPPPPPATRRAPLPPQEAISKPDYASQKSYSRGDFRSDHRASNANAIPSTGSHSKSLEPPLPPPTTSRPTTSKKPLPPPPPPKYARNEGRGFSTYDNRGNKGTYDNRSLGQSYDNRSHNQSYDNRGGTYDNRGYDNRGNYGSKRDAYDRESYDNKRKQDSYPTGKNDKKQRH